MFDREIRSILHTKSVLTPAQPATTNLKIHACMLHSLQKQQPKKSQVGTRVVYDRVRNRKNYFEIPAFLQIERGKSRAGKFKTSNENNNKNVFVFIWFWISRSWNSSFIIQKGSNFKIIFLVPYPIIYNPGFGQRPFLTFVKYSKKEHLK